jgi:ABC-type branched-subunit amino acid transport system substrate-binding protein
MEGVILAKSEPNSNKRGELSMHQRHFSEKRYRLRAGLITAMAIAALVGYIPGWTVGASAATPKPITVFLIGDWTGPGNNLTGIPDSILAGIDAINASGGINGHHVKAINCDTQENPSLGGECTEQAISAGAVVVIGDTESSQTATDALLNNAKIPEIGSAILVAEALEDPLWFDTTGGPQAAFVGMPEALAAQGAKKVSIIYPTGLGPVDSQLVSAFEEGAKIAKVSVGNVVGVPLSTSDFAPAVASALAGGADGLVAFGLGASEVSLVQAVRAADPSIPVATGTFTLTPSNISALGSSGNGLTVVGTGAQPTENIPAAKQYRADLKKYFGSAGLAQMSDQTFANWIDVQIFKDVASGLKQVTNKTLYNALKNTDVTSTGGFSPPVNLAQPCKVCGPYVRLLDPTVTFLTLKNGVLTPQKAGEFHNVFTGKNVQVSATNGVTISGG